MIEEIHLLCAPHEMRVYFFIFLFLNVCLLNRGLYKNFIIIFLVFINMFLFIFGV